MFFEHQTFWLAKDREHEAANQDAFAVDGQRGLAAIADGVSASLFSGRWAKMLVEAGVQNPPRWEQAADGAAWSAWLAPLRQQWAASIDSQALAWHQRPKLRTGALSTLLWIELAGGDGPDLNLECRAVGDSCLFHVRQGELLRAFPLAASREFTDSPCALGSVDRRRDGLIEVNYCRCQCRAGDWLALCTDSLAAWALRGYETGRPPDWPACWPLSLPQWQDAMLGLRQRGELRYDDTTLLLLRVAAGK
ncbi:MAG TPA: protein phosphatase 2C domain-containing protein [Pirellulales bacterium]